MSKESVRLILDQINIRRGIAEAAYAAGEFDNVDEQLMNLRDLLNDIYDRPEEEVRSKPSAE